MAFPDILALEDSTLLAIATYAGAAGLYLVVLPGVLLFYLKARWNVMSSVERLAAYAALFVVFPGALLLSPFLNFRPKRREV